MTWFCKQFDKLDFMNINSNMQDENTMEEVASGKKIATRHWSLKLTSFQFETISQDLFKRFLKIGFGKDDLNNVWPL